MTNASVVRTVDERPPTIRAAVIPTAATIRMQTACMHSTWDPCRCLEQAERGDADAGICVR
jgi:hypothetical protein